MKITYYAKDWKESLNLKLIDKIKKSLKSKDVGIHEVGNMYNDSDFIIISSPDIGLIKSQEFFDKLSDNIWDKEIWEAKDWQEMKKEITRISKLIRKE